MFKSNIKKKNEIKSLKKKKEIQSFEIRSKFNCDNIFIH